MPSTASDLLKLELQATGENSGTWGDRANAVFQRIGQAIAGAETVDLVSGNVTLSDTQYVAAQSRKAALILAGALTAARSVTVPARNKVYWVKNTTTGDQDVTIRPVGFTGTVLPKSGWSVVFVSAGGLDVVTLEEPPQITNPFVVLPFAAALTWDVGAAPNAVITLTGDITGLTLSNDENGGVYTLLIKQDGTGGHDFPLPAGWKWSNGAVGVIESGANVETLLTIRKIGATDIYAAPLLKAPS